MASGPDELKMGVVREDHRDEDAAAAAAAANTGGAAGAAAYLLARGGGNGPPEPGTGLGTDLADAATDLLASSGDKGGLVGPADTASHLPWYRALWKRLVSALGAKGALLALVGAIVVVALLVTTAVVVLFDYGMDAADDVETTGSGGGDKDDDTDHQSGGGDKPDTTTAATTSADATTTTSAPDEDEAAPGTPGPPGDTQPDQDPEVTTPTTASSTTVPTTTQPPAPAPLVQRFTAGWSTSDIQCPANMYAMTLRWSSRDATSATLAPAAGYTSYPNLAASDTTTVCGRMRETWRLTVAGPGGTDEATVLTPYFG